MKFWAPQPVGLGQSPHRLEIPKPLSWVYALRSALLFSVLLNNFFIILSVQLYFYFVMLLL